MTCCIILCRVAGQLITLYGFSGAEKELKLRHDLWTRMLKNWKKQGLITQTDSGRYKKVQELLS